MSLVKLANEFEQKQEEVKQPSKWRNAGIGTGIGAGLGLLGGAASGYAGAEDAERSRNNHAHRNYQSELRLHRFDEQKRDMQNETNKLFGRPTIHTKVHPPSKPSHIRVAKMPYVAGGALVSSVGNGLLGAGVGAATDVVRHINQMPQEKVASFTMASLYK